MTTKFPFKKKNVLVTGGAGFIGSHLCDELIKEHRVIAVDNFITGQEENIDHLVKNPDFEFLRHDIINPLELESFSELQKFDIKVQGVQEIYHLACPTSPKEYKKFPIETLLANAYGTKNMLEIARRYKTTFIHCSTSAVYGESLKTSIFSESDWGCVDPIGPRSAYNEGKRFAESLVVNYARQYKLSIRILRIFNTFGPRMKLDDGRMIPDFIARALSGKDIEIYSLEESTSTFCYVSDVVDAIRRVAKVESNDPINIGNTEEHRVVDIAKKIIEMTDSRSKIIIKDPLPFTVKQGVPDLDRAKKILGWFPMVSLEKGLEETVKDMEAKKSFLHYSN